MSYNSDLDLVFVYDAEPQQMTRGPKPLDHQTFYTRLGQKIIHILNTRTLSGQLYDVDMRLRPSGNSGLLVSSLAAFARYQQRDAWVWEHQALVRARPVAGDMALASRFMGVRTQVLSQPRELAPLRQAVIDMRQKMRDHLGASSKKVTPTTGFHLKQDAGGIVDIEFMVQYAALAWSHQQPALAKWTDNVRIIESLHTYGFLTSNQSQRLTEIYKVFRQCGHHLALQAKKSVVLADDQWLDEREWVKQLWHQLLMPDSMP